MEGTQCGDRNCSTAEAPGSASGQGSLWVPQRLHRDPREAPGVPQQVRQSGSEAQAAPSIHRDRRFRVLLMAASLLAPQPLRNGCSGIPGEPQRSEAAAEKSSRHEQWWGRACGCNGWRRGRQGNTMLLKGDCYCCCCCAHKDTALPDAEAVPTKTGKKEAAQWETRGDKTLEKADAPSNKGKQNGRPGGTRPPEGGHTIQHQGGHLKKALRTPNRTLFGENITLP